MATDQAQRHQLIRRTIAQRSEAVVDCSLALWDGLATVLISIIGANGFLSLYSRSVRVTNGRFPWLAIGPPLEQTDTPFASLKSSLEACGATDAREASIALLITFIDTLALLVGESVTASVLRAAWKTVGFDMDIKDIDHE